MINKELIELQKGCKATCVVVLNEDTNELDKKIDYWLEKFDLLVLWMQKTYCIRIMCTEHILMVF